MKPLAASKRPWSHFAHHRSTFAGRAVSPAAGAEPPGERQEQSKEADEESVAMTKASKDRWTQVVTLEKEGSILILDKLIEINEFDVWV